MRQRLSLTGILALAIFLAFTIFITWRAKKLDWKLRTHEEAPPLTGKMAPDFALPALDGRTISLAQYRGKKIVLSFWASWCEPCRLETPALKEFYESNRNKTDNFELLAISIDEDRGAAEAYAAESKMPFVVLLDLHSMAANAFGVDSIPTVFVVDETGKVTYSHTGYDASLKIQLARQLGFTGKSPEGDDADANSGN